MKLLRVTLLFCLVAACTPRPAANDGGNASGGDAGNAHSDAGIPDAAVHSEQDASVQVQDASMSQADAAVSPTDAGTNVVDASVGVTPDAGANPARRPVILVHGINGSADNWNTLKARLVADGWPENWIIARTFASPSWGCNVDNAATISQWVTELQGNTGQPRVDVVAHSMGSLSSRYFIKHLSGTDVVSTYVTLGGMHHGLSSPCGSAVLGPLRPCIWAELCESEPFIADLNADPATPPPVRWVSIYSTGDETVPYASSQIPGAENIEFMGVGHDGDAGLQEVLPVYEEVKRVLEYPTVMP
jgi:triacylglycerol lipase